MSVPLFKEIETLVEPQIPGWCVLEKRIALASMVLALRPDISLEIGVFGGSSFLPMALAHKAIGKGKAIGIDPWNNAAASEDYQGADKKFWGECNLQAVHDGFQAQLDKRGLRPFVSIHRVRSDAAIPPAVIDIFHLDGQHTEQAVKDCKRFCPFVRFGGLLILDDLGWSNGGPARAEQWILSSGFVKLYPLGTGAVYQKVK